jgi:hypothetical protein
MIEALVTILDTYVFINSDEIIYLNRLIFIVWLYIQIQIPDFIVSCQD